LDCDCGGFVTRPAGRFCSVTKFLPTFYAALHDITPVGAVFGDIDEESRADIQEHVEYFYYVLYGIYVKPWSAYTAAEDEIRTLNKVTLYVKTHLKEQATTQAAMDFEDTNLTQDAVKDLVADRVAIEMKSLKKELESMKKQLSENKKLKLSPKTTNTSSRKNNTRGATNASAPSQKKKGQKQQRTNAQKADARDNASTDGKKKNNANNANRNNSKNSSRKDKQD
jgi:hypothetical protein